MTARNPTAFSVLRTSRSEPRLPILARELDDLFNQQQFAVDCQDLILFDYGGIVGRDGVGVKSEYGIYNCVGGKRTGDGTGAFNAYVVFRCTVDTTGNEKFWIGTRPDHVTGWTYSSKSMPAGPTAAAWYYFGASVSIPNNGDIFIGYESPSGDGFLSGFGIFAIET